MRPCIRRETLTLLIVVVMLWCGNRAMAAGLPDKGPASTPAVTPGEATLNAIFDRIRHPEQAGPVEIIPLGASLTAVAATAPAAAEAAPTAGSAAPGAPPAGGDAWRYQWFDGRWWYWMPENRWVWWDPTHGWSDFSPPSVAGTPAPQLPAAYPYDAGPYYAGCYGYQPTQVLVAPGVVSVSAGPVNVHVNGGHVAVSVFGIGFGF